MKKVRSLSKKKIDGAVGVELIDTTDGMFMSKGEAKVLGLSGSSLLVGRK